MRKKGIFRAKEEQRKRCALLLDVRKVLENPEVEMAHEQRKISRVAQWQGEEIARELRVDYWIFTATLDDKPIKLHLIIF